MDQRTYYVMTTVAGRAVGMSVVEEVNVLNCDPDPVIEPCGALRFVSGGVVIYAPGTWAVVTGGER
jgi:hypothetical protein